jgi:TFIIF-interacting CTD phosphatase-like protein
MPRFDKLLVLDLDETLIFATESPLMRMPDLRVFDYYVYKRPGVDRFIKTCLEWFMVGVWTSSGSLYADSIVRALFSDPAKLTFVWSALRCSRGYDREEQQQVVRKDIKKLTRTGYCRENIIMVDDSPEKLGRSYGNGVIVRPYQGEPGDRELYLLIEYLELLGPVEDVRPIEKRQWRDNILRRHNNATSGASND